MVSLPGAQRVKPFERLPHALDPDVAVVDICPLVFGHLGTVENLGHNGAIGAIGASSNDHQRDPRAGECRV